MDEELRRRMEALVRHAEHVVPEDELAARLAEGRPLRVKLGLDPTARAVTLGWAVPLRKLRAFQDDGHTAVLIVGDFTARIGDPSGKSQTRPQLSKEEVQANAQEVLDQFLDILSEDDLEIRYNSEWLEGMDLPDVLALTARYTVAAMLERDDFAKRYRDRRPISIIEFMYPLLQGYDSVAVRADVELGGTDQLFNLLVGRDLQKAYGQRPQIALTMPLLVGTDGVQKMSQSLGNYVGIRDEPADMFGKVMSIPDELLQSYAALAAYFDDSAIGEVSDAVKRGGPGAGEAKRAVARATVALYHGEDAARAGEAAFDRLFRERSAPDDVPQAAIPGDAVDGDNVYLPRVLAELGLASSRSDARRLIGQGGVKVNGEQVSSEDVPVAELKGALVQVGKRKFVRLTG
ncbi:MAG TPA: tyrosine--tRNA ligase [Actinomycetota bacterium]|nr:tyrosine--tRNA ligase [Actinomycetota bacterium]